MRNYRAWFIISLTDLSYYCIYLVSIFIIVFLLEIDVFIIVCIIFNNILFSFCFLIFLLFSEMTKIVYFSIESIR